MPPPPLTAGEVAVRPVAAALKLSAATAARAARTEAVRAAAGLADRELGDRARRRNAVDLRQRRANQGTMHRSLFFLALFVAFALVLRVTTRGVAGRVRVGIRGSDFVRGLHRRVRRFLLVHRLVGVCGFDGLVGLARGVRRVGGRRLAALVHDTFRPVREHLRVERGGRLGFAPLARHFRVLELVFGIARRAPRLDDGVADHRDDGVVRHAPLARTVVVQNVTKPKLALLHQRSRRYRWQGNEMRS